jgi:PTH1 family peptidyl-tRNA hydrolase
MVIDALVNDLSVASISKPQFKGELYKSSHLFLLKPHTYMNLSGESVRAVSEYFKPEMLVVVHDDLDLKLGVIRFKTGGGHGGHNGLKSIDQHMGPAYFRVRLGIDKPEEKTQVVRHVLAPFSADEWPCVHEVVTHAVEAIKALVNHSPEEVTACFTCKRGLCDA